MKKMLLLFPPIWSTQFPHLALPLLIGQLRKYNYNAQAIDLNIEFNKYISSYEFKKFLIDKIRNKKNNDISDILSGKTDVVSLINEAFSPYIYDFPYLMLNYKDIKNFITDTEKNLFYRFFTEVLNNIISEDISNVAISLTADTQLIAGLTLAHLIKKKNIHVSVGGNYITRIKDSLLSLPEFFDFFADVVLYGEGEKSIVELARYINKETDIEKIPNIIYKKENKVIVNPYVKAPQFKDLAFPDYSDYNMDEYKDSVKILPVSASRGCYWNKCSFCDMAYSRSYSIKPVNMLINEIKNYIKTYNIKNFFFIDESVPPSYIEKFSDEIIKNKIDIVFGVYARFEKGFLNKKIFKKAHKAGLRSMLWGLESANKRVQKLINKGIDLNIVPKILEIAKSTGIVNTVCCFIGFPTETYDEAIETVKFVVKNIKNIHIPVFGEFGLGRHSIVAKNPQSFKVNISNTQMEFSHALVYSAPGLSEEEKQKIFKIINHINDLRRKKRHKIV